MHRGVTFAALPLLLSVLLAPNIASASDRELCGGDTLTAEDRIAACSRMIASGKFKGRDLSNLYIDRGNEFHNNGGNYDRAIADYDEALRIDPKNAIAWKNRGGSLYAKGDYDRAIADYSSAIRFDAKFEDAYAARGDTHYEKKDYDKAIADYTEAIRLNAKNALLFSARGGAYYQKKDYDRALANYDQALKLDAGSEDALVGRGDVHYMRKNFDRALSEYEAAARANPQSARPLVAQGNAWLQKKDFGRALSLMEEGIRLNADWDFAYSSRGDLHFERRDYDRAIADYEKASKLAPKNADYLLNIGAAYARKRDFPRAMAYFDDALRIDPKHSMAHNGRGHVFYEGGGDMDKAFVEFETAIRLDPENALAISNRGEVFLVRGELDKALADQEKALALDARLPQAYSIRGLVHLKRNDLARALADLDRGIELDPLDPYVLAARGDYYAALKEPALALADYEAALRTDARFTMALKGREAVRAALGGKEPARVAALAPAALPAMKAKGKRVALVMGNAAYRHVPKLQNTIIDARTMRDTLSKLGFEVIYGENLDKRAMGRHIGEFGAIVKDADAAIVYFAGHGSTFGDIPYVVPVDSRYQTLAEVPAELVQVETLVSELRRAKGVRLVILDACRDNEAELELKRKEAALRGDLKRGGAVGGGLARLQNPDGLIVVYSTQHMTTAADGLPGGNSPFTGALAKHLLTPGVDIKDVLFRAGQDVIGMTGGLQRPEISISLYDPFVLAP